MYSETGHLFVCRFIYGRIINIYMGKMYIYRNASIKRPPSFKRPLE